MTTIEYEDGLGPLAADALEIGVAPSPFGMVDVRVSGEIDFHNAAALRDTLLIALTSHRGTLRLDLGAVTFCDCAGLNALLAARAAALRAGRGMCITAAGRPVARLLDLTATRSLFA
ncbi:STAS domain-containing protein [Streptomyces subrutilus]|uniref:STAS domain-containing protein n=1 Tax=Streptomyces subrutilus TaxID=36818 RepID=UPI0033F2DEF8